MYEIYGKPEKTVVNPTVHDFNGLNGMLVFTVNGWNDASRHATFWNGSTCSDHCYFPLANEASIWILN
ncbi:hypothetical protein GCM10007905_12560 [Mixta theicola]|nr:hypothetical protein GCM10007905_12560 [Mixta theicola]